jgi:hypothetical protein
MMTPISSDSAEAVTRVFRPETSCATSQTTVQHATASIAGADPTPVPGPAVRAFSIGLIASSVVDELLAPDDIRRVAEEERKTNPHFRDLLALSVTCRALSEAALDVLWVAPPLVPLVALVQENSWRRRRWSTSDLELEVVRLVPHITQRPKLTVGCRRFGQASSSRMKTSLPGWAIASLDMRVEFACSIYARSLPLRRASASTQRC